MSNTIQKIECMTAGETRNAAVDFTNKLDSGELLTGTPTITASSTLLTLSNKVVNTAALTINGSTVSIGQAVQFAVAASTSSPEARYSVTITTVTNSTPAQTFIATLGIQVTT